MRLLLDTHVFLWWCDDNARLNGEARRSIAAAEQVFVSAASVWEGEIKAALGRLQLPAPFDRGVAASGFLELAISFRHARAAGRLPAHHHDPFDRMLVAQAISEGLVLVTHDRAMAPYEVTVLWT